MFAPSLFCPHISRAFSVGRLQPAAPLDHRSVPLPVARRRPNAKNAVVSQCLLPPRAGLTHPRAGYPRYPLTTEGTIVHEEAGREEQRGRPRGGGEEDDRPAARGGSCRGSGGRGNRLSGNTVGERRPGCENNLWKLGGGGREARTGRGPAGPVWRCRWCGGHGGTAVVCRTAVQLWCGCTVLWYWGGGGGGAGVL